MQDTDGLVQKKAYKVLSVILKVTFTLCKSCSSQILDILPSMSSVSNYFNNYSCAFNLITFLVSQKRRQCLHKYPCLLWLFKDPASMDLHWGVLRIWKIFKSE